MKTRLLAWIIICSVGVLFVLLCSLWAVTPVMERSIEAHVKVDEYIGFNLDTDRLYFGAVGAGGSANRPAYIHVDDDYFVRIVIDDSVMGGWVTVLENSFFIGENETIGIEFHIDVPEGTPFGNYTADVDTIFYRPIARFFFK